MGTEDDTNDYTEEDDELSPENEAKFTLWELKKRAHGRLAGRVGVRIEEIGQNSDDFESEIRQRMKQTRD